MSKKWQIIIASTIGTMIGLGLAACAAGGVTSTGTVFTTTTRTVETDDGPAVCVVFTTTEGGIAASCNWSTP